MLTLEMAIAKLRQLPPEKQQQFLQLIEALEEKPEESEDFFAIAGIWSNREITAETLRQEAWKEQKQ